jgi:predicted amidohydrolase
VERSLTAAVAQASPVHGDLGESLEKALKLIGAAARKGAEIVAFGESWLSGYPAWLDHAPGMGLWDHKPTKRAYAQMLSSALPVPGRECAAIATAAKENEITVIMGATERPAAGKGSGTIYNSLLTFDERGRLANHHRKLVPTFTERMVWAHGDAEGLQAVRTGAGLVGGLVCWEHWMPLARQAMHDSGEEIHAAVWPRAHDLHHLASRHYAFEGRCFVLVAGQLMRVKDVPDGLSLPPRLRKRPAEFLLDGGSAIVAPDGRYLAGPVRGKEEILVAKLDLDEIAQEKLTLDTTGHYQRHDVFGFEVRRARHVRGR